MTLKEWLRFAAVIVGGILIAAIVTGMTVTFTVIHPLIALVLGYVAAGFALLTVMGDWTDAGTDAARHRRRGPLSAHDGRAERRRTLRHMPDMVDALVSIREAARALDLTEAEVRRRIAAGELKAVRLGAQRVWEVRVPARELERPAETAGAAR